MRLEVGAREAAAPEGLRDDGHLLVACSNCRALLMDVWRTRPHEPQVWKVRASCPFCGDRSFVHEVRGGFHFGGYATPKEDDASDDVPVTVVENWEINGDRFEFTVVKARADAQPVRG